jgi:hypothetical protein
MHARTGAHYPRTDSRQHRLDDRRLRRVLTYVEAHLADDKVVEVLDQWYGPDYRYCKVKGGDGALYILHLDESRSEWHLTMLFASARAAGTAEVSLTQRQTELLHDRGREHKRDGH